MKRLIAGLALVQALGGGRSALAYHAETHQRISRAAVNASVLNSDIVKTIGLKALDEDQRFPNSKRVSRSIRGLLQDGSIFEDELPRVVNHFYEPVHNIPLTIPFTDLPFGPVQIAEIRAVFEFGRYVTLARERPLKSAMCRYLPTCSAVGPS